MPNNIVNALTIDVEDYFNTEAMAEMAPRRQWSDFESRVERSTRRVLEMLEARSIRATFFVLGWTASRHPALVRDIAALGHELGCHSFYHEPVFRLSPARFHKDTYRSKQLLEDISGVRVLGYRAPSFSLVNGTKWALHTLAELGFEYDCSINPVHHPLYGNSDARRTPHLLDSGIWEFPVATVGLGPVNVPIGGGAYFRLAPYKIFRLGWDRLNREEGLRGIFYFHPWEIDADQPRLRARFTSRLRQYTNLASTEKKLERLISDFQFGPVCEVYEPELSGAVVRNSTLTPAVAPA